MSMLRAGRRADGLEHGREYLIAILQGLNALARHDGRSQQHAHLAPEHRIALYPESMRQ